VQYFMKFRGASMNDVFLNIGGAMLGLLGVLIHRKMSARRLAKDSGKS